MVQTAWPCIRNIETIQHQVINGDPMTTKKMTLEELTNHFRHQLTATEDFVPTPEKLEYQTIDSTNGNKITGFAKLDSLPGLLEMLNTAGFQFEGFRDKAPYFVKPEVQIAL